MRRRQEPGAALRAELAAKLREYAARPWPGPWGAMADDLDADRPVEVPPFVHEELFSRFPRAGRVLVAPDGRVSAVERP